MGRIDREEPAQARAERRRRRVPRVVIALTCARTRGRVIRPLVGETVARSCRRRVAGHGGRVPTWAPEGPAPGASGGERGGGSWAPGRLAARGALRPVHPLGRVRRPGAP